MKLSIIFCLALVGMLWWLKSNAMFDAVSHSTQFLILLSLVLAVGFSGFLLYCLVTGRVYNGRAPMRGEWVYRNEDTFIYWMYIAYFSLLDSAVIYEFITYLHQYLIQKK